MPFDPAKHHRRSLRLSDYDYSETGAYFLTICVHDRACLLGRVIDGGMLTNQFGNIVREEWERSAHIRKELMLDEYVVMPNHIRGIVFLEHDGETVPGANGRSPLQIRTRAGQTPRSLSSFVAGFKSATTKRINEARRTPGTAFWQRNYYEHVIRTEESLSKIRQYIANNPLKWELDELHPNYGQRTSRCLPEADAGLPPSRQPAPTETAGLDASRPPDYCRGERRSPAFTDPR